MNQVEAARAVLLEVMNVLGAFGDDIVIVGGWVPDLMYPGQHHMGSLDVDLAIGPGAEGASVYSTIQALLADRGYDYAAPPPFYRTIPGADRVKIDLISGQYFTGDKAKAVQVDELCLSSLRGIDLAFEHCEEIKIEGMMPDGSHNIVRARIVRPEAFILIKAFAIAERGPIKIKDAYDVAFILHHYQPSLDELAKKLMPIIAGGLGVEAYQILTEKFAKLESVGPTWAAQVAAQNGEDYDQAQQAAFQDAQELFAQVRRVQS